MNPSALEEELEKSFAPQVNSLGLGIVAIRVNKSRDINLQVFLEKLDNSPITIEECAKASRHIKGLIEVENFFLGKDYFLEVSSPGVDRPLTKEADFERFKGKKAKVNTYTSITIDGLLIKRLTGIIKDFQNKTVTLALEDGKEAEIEFHNIRSSYLIGEVSLKGLDEKKENVRENSGDDFRERRFDDRREDRREGRRDDRGGDRKFDNRQSGFKKPYRRDEGNRSERSFSDRPRREFDGDRPSSDRPYKKPYRSNDDRGERGFSNDRPSSDRPYKKPYRRDEGGREERSFSDKPRREFNNDRPTGDRPYKKPYRRDEGGREERSFSNDRPYKKPYRSDDRREDNRSGGRDFSGGYASEGSSEGGERKPFKKPYKKPYGKPFGNNTGGGRSGARAGSRSGSRTGGRPNNRPNKNFGGKRNFNNSTNNNDKE